MYKMVMLIYFVTNVQMKILNCRFEREKPAAEKRNNLFPKFKKNSKRSNLLKDSSSDQETEVELISEPENEIISEPDVEHISGSDIEIISEREVESISGLDIELISEPDVELISKHDLRPRQSYEYTTAAKPINEVIQSMEPSCRY